MYILVCRFPDQVQQHDAESDVKRTGL